MANARSANASAVKPEAKNPKLSAVTAQTF